MELNVVLTHEDAVPPSKANATDAGFDLYSVEDVKLAPHERKIVSTGINIAIPKNHAGLVFPRSGLAANKGATVLNAPGLIDEDYRGDVGVILYNSNSNHYLTLNKGNRIAQLVVIELPYIWIKETDKLSETERGNNGWGSSGS